MVLGGSQGEPLSSSSASWQGLHPPGPCIHPQPLSKGSYQQVRAQGDFTTPCLPILWLLWRFKNSLSSPVRQEHPLLPGK